MKDTKGITLIALVITIVVLIILAGVTIAMLTGENGILNKANQAKAETSKTNAMEKLQLEIAGLVNDDGTYSLDDSMKNKLIERLQPTPEIVNENGLFKVTYDGYTFKVDSLGTVVEYLIANNPVITSDMTPIKWSETEEVSTTVDDLDWYNYDKNKWANAKTSDGSYWVWIPRYEYKITNAVTDPSKAGIININFISNSTTTPTNGYTIHPAFTNDFDNNFDNGGWDKELSGFWVAKYEMGMEKDGLSIMTTTKDIGNVLSKNSGNTQNISVVSKPGITSWSVISPGNMYTNSYNYDRVKESHLMKNSEWGATVYLTHSNYGRNGSQVTFSNSFVYGNPCTGGGEGSAYKSNTNQSTTGNITGIYDLNGCSWEYLATWNTLASDTYDYLEKNGKPFATKNSNSTKYATAYKNETNIYQGLPLINSVCKIGDAIKEVFVIDNLSWFNNASGFASSDFPFFLRGGSIEYEDIAGIFSCNGGDGNAWIKASFRTVLAI